MSSSLSSAHHWKLWSECGTGPFTDGSVGHNGSPSHYVQWPTKPGQLGHSHPTEQGGHCHQPGPTGDPGQTSGAGCHQHWHIGLFTTDVPVNHSLESSLVLVRLDVLMFCSCGFFFLFFFYKEKSHIDVFWRPLSNSASALVFLSHRTDMPFLYHTSLAKLNYQPGNYMVWLCPTNPQPHL